MRLSTIPTLLSIALITGCATYSQPLSNCPSSHLVPPFAADREVVRLAARGGHFDSTPLKSARFGESIAIRAALIQPDASKSWASSFGICVVGPSEPDKQCVHYYIDQISGHFVAVFTQYPAPGRAAQATIPTAAVAANVRIDLSLTLREDEFELLMCDGVRFKSQTPFPINGYRLNCVGATCEFERPT